MFGKYACEIMLAIGLCCFQNGTWASLKSQTGTAEEKVFLVSESLQEIALPNKEGLSEDREPYSLAHLPLQNLIPLVEDLYHHHRNEKAQGVLFTEESQHSLRAMIQMVFLISADKHLGHYASDYTTFFFGRSCLQQKLKQCLLDLRKVGVPTGEQKYFNGLTLGFVLGELAEQAEPTKYRPALDRAHVNRFLSFTDYAGQWHGEDLFDEERFALAQEVATEYLEKLKLGEFFQTSLPLFLDLALKEWNENFESIDRDYEDILNEKKNDFKDVWKFNIDADDKDEALKQEALRHPTDANVLALLDVIKRLSGEEHEKKRRSVVRVLRDIIEPYNGNEIARKFVSEFCFLALLKPNSSPPEEEQE
ncbi:hypothetical protein AGMMS49949_07920 [Alphaproteobacteria bacterium]|nr:hypothetical protein AGMMS49949_07920 [Alphaproteobacteria bacterium]